MAEHQRAQRKRFTLGWSPTLQRRWGGWEQRWWSGNSQWPSHQRCRNENHHTQGSRHSHATRTTTRVVVDIHWVYFATLSCTIIRETEASQQEWGHPLFFPPKHKSICPWTSPTSCYGSGMTFLQRIVHCSLGLGSSHHLCISVTVPIRSFPLVPWIIRGHSSYETNCLYYLPS